MQRKRKPLSQLDGQVTREKRQRSDDEQSLTPTGNDNSRAGTVLQMVLRNFMCHSLLEVNFKTNINYIIGRNGSGKSAILTGLVVGLGGKASLTNRGSSIKGFIKAGKTSGSVEVTLNNKGPMAYKPNIYGQKITIIRHFSSSGSNSYKVKSATGEIIANNAKEVQNICSSLNIQINNPVCLLNQDTSRNFLNTKDPHQKFLLFMRATGLNLLYEEYKRVNNNKKHCQNMLKERETKYEELKKELKELDRKLQDHKSIINLKDKVAQLQNEVLWAKVRDSEEDVLEQQRVVDQLEEEKANLQENVQSQTQHLQAAKDRIVSLQNQIDEIRAAALNHKQPQIKYKKILERLEETLNEKKREKRSLQMDIKSKTKECEVLEREIAKAAEKLGRAEQEKVDRLRKIAEQEQKIKEIQSLLETSRNDQFQMQNSLARLRENEYQLKSEIDQFIIQKASTQANLNAIKNESNNSLAVYGQDMPRVLQAINASKTKFKHLPRGPLGAYITLKDKKWAVAVEGYINPNLLKGFAVDNQHDNALLMKIFSNCWSSGSKPTIITSKFFFNVHDVSKHLVARTADCISIYNAIEVSDPVVMNCLIDQLSIESVLLIPSNNKAIELLSNAARVPRNCREGVTVEGDRYYPDPNYKTYASRYKRAQYLQVSTTDLINQLEEKLQELEDRKKTSGNQLKAVKTDLHGQTERMQQLDIKIGKLNQVLVTLRRQNNDLQALIDPDFEDIQTFELELAEIKSAIEQRQEVVEKINDDASNIENDIRNFEEQLSRMREAGQQFEERIVPMEAQISEEKNKQNEWDINSNFRKRHLNECNNKIRLANVELSQKKTIVEEQTHEASSIGPRPRNIRKVPVVIKELNENQATIRSIEIGKEKPEELAQKYEDHNFKFQQVSVIIRALQDDVKELHEAANKRNRYYAHTEDFFVTFVKSSFQKILEFRQFEGSLEIDMKDKKLDMIVIPQQGSQGHTTTANLSGGERSFSTVAFLYSLWQCMEFPFYFLDEFDVFMDKVNRTKVMEVLLYHAKKVPHLQFVFLTPQDVSFIHDKNVAVHRLEDPERKAVA